MPTVQFTQLDDKQGARAIVHDGTVGLHCEHCTVQLLDLLWPTQECLMQCRVLVLTHWLVCTLI
jgi:hypothetical protein